MRLAKWGDSLAVRLPAAAAEALELLGALRGLLQVEPLTAEVHDSGLALAERYSLPV